MTPRCPRIPTPGVTVRVSSLIGQLINVSETGALVRTSQILSIGREWPVVLSLPNSDEPLIVRAQVVRYEVVEVPLNGAVWSHRDYALGLAFTFLPDKARAALEALCAGASERCTDEVPEP